jgi:exodeoxyribonuclease X
MVRTGGLMTEFLVVDTESTGFSCAAGAVVVDIGLCRLSWPSCHDQAIDFAESYFIDPGVAIPPEVSAIHHIVNDDVMGAPSWESAPAIINSYGARLLGASRRFDFVVMHNSRHDEQWITPEVTGGLPVIDTLRVARELWPDAPGHSNQVLRYWLAATGRMHAPHGGVDRKYANMAHRAGPDAYVTAHILRAALQHMWVTDHGGRTFGEMGFADIGGLGDVSAPHIKLLHEWSTRPSLLHKVGFGMYKGKLWANIPDNYYEWVLKNIHDKPDVRFTAQHYLNLANGIGSKHDR